MPPRDTALVFWGYPENSQNTAFPIAPSAKADCNLPLGELSSRDTPVSWANPVLASLCAQQEAEIPGSHPSQSDHQMEVLFSPMVCVVLSSEEGRIVHFSCICIFISGLSGFLQSFFKMVSITGSESSLQTPCQETFSCSMFLN